jgi:hypothetical protein
MARLTRLTGERFHLGMQILSRQLREGNNRSLHLPDHHDLTFDETDYSKRSAKANQRGKGTCATIGQFGLNVLAKFWEMDQGRSDSI